MQTATVDQKSLIDRLKALPRAQLLAMYEAAAEATECAAALAEAGTNPVTEVLKGAEAIEEWMHFPEGDVCDPATHSQFYYHAHAAAERAGGEHGHFHTFVRPKQLAPALAPTADATPDAGDPVTHLVGISTNATGQVIGLFTTNRWVTGEAWYDADAVIGLLDRFDITVEAPSRHLNRWVGAVVRMFRPQIADLIRARDAKVASFKAAHPGRDVYEDRDLQVTSEMPVDFLAQIRAIEAALQLQPAQ